MLNGGGTYCNPASLIGQFLNWGSQKPFYLRFFFQCAYSMGVDIQVRAQSRLKTRLNIHGAGQSYDNKNRVDDFRLGAYLRLILSSDKHLLRKHSGPAHKNQPQGWFPVFSKGYGGSDRSRTCNPLRGDRFRGGSLTIRITSTTREIGL